MVITVPTGATGGLTINLTNNLSFDGNTVPTSLMIVGQFGGGLGDAQRRPRRVPTTQRQGTTTWPIAERRPSVHAAAQGPRVQSFATEVAAGATTALTWTAPRPGHLPD